jgi:photosystem II stability/assembly factor-like uncharacterized protein
VGSSIVKTIDGGANWTEVWNGWGSKELYSVFFTDANRGYAVGSDFYMGEGIIFKTEDGGDTWTEQSSGTVGSLASVYFTDAMTGYASGNNNPYGYSPETGTIFKTTDGGEHWILQVQDTIKNIYSVFFTDENTGYAVGEGGTILKTTNGGGYPVEIQDTPGIDQSLDIYPNPVSGAFVIRNTSEGTLFILGTGGQELMRDQVIQPTATIDINFLPAGIYIVKLVSRNGVQVGKIVKQ